MYRYRITVESLGAETPEQLQFETESHDDIFAIVRKTASAGDLDEQSAKALAVGLKLFSGAVLRNRSNPLFAQIQPALGEFIQQLKSRGRGPH